jgi:hypothetical protein
MNGTYLSRKLPSRVPKGHKLRVAEVAKDVPFTDLRMESLTLSKPP